MSGGVLSRAAAFCAWLGCLGAAAPAAAQPGQRASFDLELIREGRPGFDADPVIEGPPGTVQLFSADLLIVQSGYGDDGIQGWAFGLWHSNLDLISITTEGTVLADKEDGGLFDLGFRKYETIDPAKNGGKRGVVQGVALSFFRNVVLPDARNIVGRQAYRAEVPEGGGTAFLRYTDGLRGSGQPVVTVLSINGSSAFAGMGGREIVLGSGAPPEKGHCADGMDNDRDGWTDCDDPQCRVLVECGGEVCGDGIDNDGDMHADCADPDCLPGSCYEECGDRVDNDGDSLIDCDDPECWQVSPCRVPEVCADDIDNDRDGRTDCKDPECEYIGDCPGPEICGDNIDNDLDGALDCNDINCVGLHPCVGPEDCENGEDDNGDGKVDCDDSFCLRFSGSCDGGGEVCDDGIDNDRDTRVDCADPQCFGVGGCPPPEVCGDGIDNDEDGFTDCLDSNCTGIPPCFGREVCRDRRDNDGDGWTDCRDPDCAGTEDCPPPEICGDGLDNDRDLRVDCDDRDCRLHASCPVAEVCNDALDNDKDGKTDCADPECFEEPSCGAVEGFDLVISAEDSIIVNGQSVVEAQPLMAVPITVYIVPFPGPQSAGAQGWSLSVVHDRELLGFDPDGGAPTIAGTDAEALFSGGFQKTEVGRSRNGAGAGAGEDPVEGFISATVLSLTEAAELDPRRAQSIARARYVLERPIDPGQRVTTIVRFVDGLRGSGQPVRNLLTVRGSSLEPVHLVPLEIRFSTDTRFLRGDANGDEKVDMADAVWSVNELVRRGPAAPCERAADANGDGLHDLSDPMYLIQWLFLSGPVVPQPFPACGRGAGSASLGLECPEGSVRYCRS